MTCVFMVGELAALIYSKQYREGLNLNITCLVTSTKASKAKIQLYMYCLSLPPSPSLSPSSSLPPSLFLSPSLSLSQVMALLLMVIPFLSMLQHVTFNIDLLTNQSSLMFLTKHRERERLYTLTMIFIS